MSVVAQRAALMRELEAFHANAFQLKAKIGGVVVKKKCRWAIDQITSDGAIIKVQKSPFKPWEQIVMTHSQYQKWTADVAAEKAMNERLVMRAMGTV